MEYLKEDILKKAIEAKEHAYAPYSKFHVGAAVLTEDGNVYTGSNIENSSYPATICAERVAISTAVHSGSKKIKMLAIAGDSDYTHPCGICRQVLVEFSDEETLVIVGKDTHNFKVYSVNELLPYAFTKEDIGEEDV